MTVVLFGVQKILEPWVPPTGVAVKASLTDSTQPPAHKSVSIVGIG